MILKHLAMSPSGKKLKDVGKPRRVPRLIQERSECSKAKKRCKTLSDERKTSIQASGLPSSSDHLGLMHSDMDFIPSPKPEKNKKATSTSPSRPITD